MNYIKNDQEYGAKGYSEDCPTAAEEAKDKLRGEVETYLNKVAEAIAADSDVRAAVKGIEAGIKTTKGNYGRYMALLSPYAKEKAFCLGMARGLKRCGADPYGVESALTILIRS